ncbi:MAG: Gfo/Idh/MocA family oxidoreductase [Spirochaetaceae bacterium]|nr:MAG: Gfo/Idh/MocA family oxidoreductase [Spirochaetaceae bacterium]
MYPTLIIGIRNRGMAWAEAIQAHPDFELAGVADIDSEILQKRSGELKLPEEGRYLDYRKALDSGRYQVVIVVTPNHLHYRMAKDVLDAGIHCVLEKPFAEKMTQAEELVRLAHRKSLSLVIGHNYRFKMPFIRITDVIREGRLGRLIGGEISFHRHRPPRFEHERAMSYPLLFLQGIHHLDLLISFLPSPIEEIHCRHYLPPASPWNSPSVCQLILRCADGALLGYRGSYECRGEQTPYNGLWRLEFEQGDIVLDQSGKLWQVGVQGVHCLYETQEGERSADELLLDTVKREIEEGMEAPTSGRNNLVTLAMLFDVIKAGENPQNREYDPYRDRQGQ